MKTKQIIVILVCLVMMMVLASCGESKENVQIPNPWTECASIEEAVEKAGFSFGVPSVINGFQIGTVQNINTTMIEVILDATDDSGNSIRIRKGPGTDDISGDYNDYAESNHVIVGSYDVLMKGEQGTVSLATWTYEGYSFALSTPEISLEKVIEIIQQIS